MEIIAHRGASFDAPENSIEAIEIALAMNADRIEIDIQMTRDGIAVVSHDADTERCGDVKVEIASSTFDALREVRLSNGETIPTLEEVCERIAERGRLDVEIKAKGTLVAEECARLLAEYELDEDGLITSFDAAAVRAVRRLGFAGRIGLLAGSKSFAPKKRAFETWPLLALKRCGADSLAIHHKLAHPLLRAALRRSGHGLYLWMSMEDEFEAPELREIAYRKIAAVDPLGMICGRVGEARAVVEVPRPR